MMGKDLCELSIDDRSVEHMKKLIESEGEKDIRIFIGGGGCCKWLEMAPVDHALAGDVTYKKKMNTDEIAIHVERRLVEDNLKIEIRFDENDGLLIDLM